MTTPQPGDRIRLVAMPDDLAHSDEEHRHIQFGRVLRGTRLRGVEATNSTAVA
jgi:hypothetical protein